MWCVFTVFSRLDCDLEPALAEALRAHDEQILTEEWKKAHPVSKRERRRRLEALSNSQPVEARPDNSQKLKPQSTKVFQVYEGPLARVDQWVKDRRRVNIRLRAHRHEPNRLLQVI